MYARDDSHSHLSSRSPSLNEQRISRSTLSSVGLAPADPSTIHAIPNAKVTSSSTSHSSPESTTRVYSPHIHSQSSSKRLRGDTPQPPADEFPHIISYVEQGAEPLDLVDPTAAYNQLAYQNMLLSYSSMLATAASTSSGRSPPVQSSFGKAQMQFLPQLQYQNHSQLPFSQSSPSYSTVITSSVTNYPPPSTPAFTVGPPAETVKPSNVPLPAVESLTTVSVDLPLQPAHSRTSSISSSTIEPSFHHSQFSNDIPEVLQTSQSNFLQPQPPSHLQKLHIDSHRSLINTTVDNPPSSRQKKAATSRQMKSQDFDFDHNDDSDLDDDKHVDVATKTQTKRPHKHKKHSQTATGSRYALRQQAIAASIAKEEQPRTRGDSQAAICINFHDEHTSSIDVMEVELMPPRQIESSSTATTTTKTAVTTPFTPPPILRGGRSTTAGKHSRSTRHLTLDEVKSGQLRSISSLISTFAVHDMKEQYVVPDSSPAKQFTTAGMQHVPTPSSPSHLSKFTTQCYYLALLIHQHTRGTMPAANALMLKHWFTAFLDAYLRGWGQVVFQNNPLTGLAIIVAMLINNQWIAIMGIYATFVSTLFAKLLGLNPGAYQAGLFGYNAVLVGLGIAIFDTRAMGEWNAAILGPIGLMSMFSVIALVAFGNVLGKFHVTPLTLPFNISAIFYLVGAVAMNYFAVPFYSGSSGPKTIHTRISEPLTIDWGQWLRAIPIGVGQVFLAAELSSGIICILGIAICSPWSAAMSFLGSMVGQLAALGLGIDTALIYGDASTPPGLYGYNSVLGAIAIGGFFYLPNVKSTCMAIFCATMCAVLQACFKVLFINWGGFPTLTFPFCITTLFFLLLHHSMPNMLIPIPLSILTYPEEHRHRHRIHEQLLERVKHAAGFIRVMEKEDQERNGKNNLNQSTSNKQNTDAISAAMEQSILAKKASFRAMRNTSKRALIQAANKSTEGSDDSTESLYYKAELSRQYSTEEMEQRSAACRSFLDQLFDLLDPDGGASCITFQQLRASLNQVLGNAHTTRVISTQQMALWMMDFQNREAIAQRVLKRKKTNRNADDSDRDAGGSSDASEDESLELTDWNFFLSLDPSDIYIEYDDLFRLFMYYRPIDWKSQFLDDDRKADENSDEVTQRSSPQKGLTSHATVPANGCQFGGANFHSATKDTLLKKVTSVHFAEVREEMEEEEEEQPLTACPAQLQSAFSIEMLAVSSLSPHSSFDSSLSNPNAEQPFHLHALRTQNDEENEQDSDRLSTHSQSDT